MDWGKLLGGIGRTVLGGGQQQRPPGAGMQPPPAGGYGVGGANTGYGGMPGGGTSAAIGPYDMGASGPADGGGQGWLGAIGSFLTKNPEVVTGIVGTGADVFGSIQEGKARDKELEWRKEQSEKELEEERKRREDDRVRMLIQAMSSGY